MERQRILFKGGQIARAAYDQALRDWGVAQADFQAAARTERLLAAPALPEMEPIKAGPSKRKKEGAFYTPAFVTRYIVAETLHPIALVLRKKTFP